MFIRSEGGVIKRAGLQNLYKYTDITYNAAKTQQTRLMPFIFSDDEQYIVSMENAKIRVFIINPSTGAVTLTATVTADVDGAALPFSDVYLHEYTFAQSGDVLFVCHPLFMPRQIVRTSLTAFQVETFTFDTRSDKERIYQPYYNFHNLGVSLTPSGTSSSITLTIGEFSAEADDDGISVSAQVANEANLVLGGALASSGSVTFVYGRLVTITSGGNDSGFAFTVTGTNVDGDAQTEAITGANAGVATGTKFFKTITQIASAGDPAGTVKAGVTDKAAVPYFDTTGSQAGGNYANSKHVGVTLLYHNSEILITSVQSGTQAIGTVLDSLFVQLKANALKTISGSATVEVTHVNHGMRVGDSVTLSECAAVGNISTSNLNGARTITGIIDDNHYTFTAGGSANASIDGGGSPKVTSAAPTTDWAEQSYSDLRGFPSAITFHQNRLCFAGTIAQPDTIWMSKSASYYNFDTGDANDSDSIHLTASIGEVQQIRHLVSNRDLQVFTASSEMYVPAFQDKPITPTNAQVRRQTPFGSDSIRPQVLDGATIFVQAGGSIVREYLFTDTEEAYTAVPVSSLSSHLIDTPVEMNTFYGAVDRSESYVFVRNASGKMAVFNSNRAEQRAGWAEFTSQGLFHSTVTIDDRVFANVAFPMGNDTTRYVLCEFKADSNMDMDKTYTATSSNNGIFTVSADFENGAVVNVVSGNNYIGEFTVAGGVVNVSAVEGLNTAEIGYKFDVTLTTNPIDTNTQGGPVSGKIRSLASVVVDLNSTLSISVNGANLVIRQVTDDMSNEQAAFTGRKEFRLMGYSRTPQITISQSAPLPLQVNGLIAELVF
tara:strand:- start:117 stop:2609 length:2493 start_codon:yes stop_codon:yes gene_type:complete